MHSIYRMISDPRLALRVFKHKPVFQPRTIPRGSRCAWHSCRKWICVFEHVEEEREREKKRDGEEKGENKHKYLPRLFAEAWNRIGKNGKSARYFKHGNGTAVARKSS